MKPAALILLLILWAGIAASGAYYVHQQNLHSCRHRHGVEVCYERRWRHWGE